MKRAGTPGEETVGDALVRELQWLRKGEGMTLRRLSCAPALLTVAAGDRGAAERGEQVVHTAEQLLRRGLDSLGHGLGAEALRAALAIDLEDPQTLTQRRYDFAERHQKHPDTVENHENRTIQELALRLQVLAASRRDGHNGAGFRDAGGDEPAPTTGQRRAGRDTRLSLVSSNDTLVQALLDVVESAEHCVVAVGSRSRDPNYLTAIEHRIERTGIAHYRVLCGPPHWAVLKDHLVRLLAIKAAQPVGGNQRIFIGVVSDFSREPERFLCANEHEAVIVLPSLNGVERYDTALKLEGAEFGMAYVRLVQELYAGAQPVETHEDVAALALVREG